MLSYTIESSDEQLAEDPYLTRPMDEVGCHDDEYAGYAFEGAGGRKSRNNGDDEDDDWDEDDDSDEDDYGDSDDDDYEDYYEDDRW